MPRPWRIRFGGATYHVTSRGNGRKAIFGGDEDRARFLEQLEEALDLDGVRLYAYVLMPNHYHLVVATPMGNIHRFMQRLNTAYGMYHRFKHRQPGHCFQGRYGAKLVKGDEYLVRVIRYVHLNPVKGKRWEGVNRTERLAALNGYRWSSYPGYVDRARAADWVDYRWLKGMGRKTMAGNRRAYRGYVESLLLEDDEVLAEALKASSYAVGDRDYREEIAGELKEARVRRGVYGKDVAWPEKRVDLGRVEAAVCRAYGVSADGLTSRGRSMREARRVYAELASRLSGRSQREIGRRLGYTSDSAVGKQRQVLRAQVGKDPGLARRLEALLVELGKR